MCSPASMIVCKDRIFWSPTTDSHEDIIAEFGLCPDNGRNAKIVRVEISPPDGRLDSDSSAWVFKTDQIDVPEWYDPVEAERLCRLELSAWKAAKVFVDGEHIIRKGQVYVYGTAKVELWDSSSAELYDSSSAKLHDHSSAVLRDSSSAELYDSSSAELYDRSSAELYGSSSAVVWSCDKVTVMGDAVAIRRDGNLRFQTKDTHD